MGSETKNLKGATTMQAIVLRPPADSFTPGGQIVLSTCPRPQLKPGQVVCYD
jgi:hypothetical protein